MNSKGRRRKQLWTQCCYKSYCPDIFPDILRKHIKIINYPSQNNKLLAYADDVNILGGGIHTLKENAEALVAATREIGLEVSAHKTKYMVMSRDQNAGQNHSVRIDNSTFERVEEFKYLRTTLTI